MLLVLCVCIYIYIYVYIHVCWRGGVGGGVGVLMTNKLDGAFPAFVNPKSRVQEMFRMQQRRNSSKLELEDTSIVSVSEMCREW